MYLCRRSAAPTANPVVPAGGLRSNEVPLPEWIAFLQRENPPWYLDEFPAVDPTTIS
jgi:hypothetical protein